MSSRIDRRWLSALFLGIAASFAAAGCGDSSSSSGGSLTLYSSQHEPMTEALVEGFEKETGADGGGPLRRGRGAGQPDRSRRAPPRPPTSSSPRTRRR